MKRGVCERRPSVQDSKPRKITPWTVCFWAAGYAGGLVAGSFPWRRRIYVAVGFVDLVRLALIFEAANARVMHKGLVERKWKGDLNGALRGKWTRLHGRLEFCLLLHHAGGGGYSGLHFLLGGIGYAHLAGPGLARHQAETELALLPHPRQSGE